MYELLNVWISGMADDSQHDLPGTERILESVHPSLVERYYQPKYIIGNQTRNFFYSFAYKDFLNKVK